MLRTERNCIINVRPQSPNVGEINFFPLLFLGGIIYLFIYFVKNLLRGSQPIFRFSKIEKPHIMFLLNLISTSDSLCHWSKYIKSLIRTLIPIPF
jgi:hypothetical protein